MFIELGIVDPNGVLKTRTFFGKKYEELIEEGFGFDAYSVGYLPIEDSDAVAKPIKSPKILSNTIFDLCEIWRDGKPLEWEGRNVLRETLKRHGIEVRVGYELEFYVLKEKRNGSYMDSFPSDDLKEIKKELLKKLNELGIKAYLEHHEVGNSQHEITIENSDAIKKADEYVFYKYFLHRFFEEHGLSITFMPKPFKGEPGNGLHLNLSVWKNGKNLFKGNGRISEFGRKFISGILTYAKEISLVTNTTVNSYKRLVPGMEAPVYISWGYGNRSTLIRVPLYTRKIDRIEVRSPDPLINIYYALAAIIEAGMRGVEENLSIEPIEFDVYEKNENLDVLPRNLGEAIKFAKKGKILKKLMGEFFDRFIFLKEKEWDEYRKNTENFESLEISEWEKEKYMRR